jgi:hypothetical protein
MNKGILFLHSHPQMEKQLNVDKEHVIVDRNAWEFVNSLNQSKEGWYIGIDTYDTNYLTYVLAYKNNLQTQIVLSNHRNTKLEFDKEVENLKKYFDAVEIKEMNNYQTLKIV